MSTIPNNNSTIFKTKNNELAIFGKTIDEVKEKLDTFVKTYNQNGHQLFGEGGAFSSLFSGKKATNIITPELLSQFDDFKERFNNSKLSAEALAEEMGDVDSSIVNYAKTCKNGELTTEGFTAALKQQTLGAKAATVATKALAMAGNMLVAWAVTKGIELAVKAIDDYIHRLDNAKEALSNTQSELSSVNSEIDETTDKIKELEALDPSSLSITDKEDLQRLKDQNEELRIRQQYLEQQEKADLKKVADFTKEKYGLKYNDSASREDIDAYKELYENPSKQSKPASTYLTGAPSDQATPYAAGLQNQHIMKGSDSLASLIAQYEYFEEQKKNAIKDEDVESIDKYNQKIEEIAQKLRDDRTELQGFSDDLSATGESSAVLDDINSKLKLIDDTLLTKGQNLVNFINSDAIADDKEKLVELANSGKLTADVLSNKFSDVDQYLKDNGLTLEDLISIIKTYKEELADLPNNETAISIAPTISSSISQLATQLEPQFAELGEAYKAIFTDEGFTLDDVDNSMLEKLRQSFAEIEEEVGVAFDATKLDPFFDTLTNGSSTAEQVQQAFNDLATAYFYSTDTLEQLNAETADAIEKQLEEMGVVNAQTVVADALAAKTEELIVQKEYLAQTGKQLSDASNEEVTAFILEQIEAGNCGESLALLQLKKLLVNSTQINTAADIQQIMNLASAAGMGAEVLTQLANAKSILSTVENGGTVSMTSYNKALADVENAKQTMLDWKPIELDFNNVGGGASSAGSAGSEAGDAYVEAFEEELSELETLRDQGKITEKEYLDYLRALYEKYFKDRKEYLDEYNKYERQYLEGRHTCPLLQ